MIAKISRGTSHAGLASYLHGPGKANEHSYETAEGQRHPGGVVIASNVGREGDTEGRWAGDLRRAANQRDDVKKPVWHASLRNGPNDRKMSDAEWADAAQSFAEKMGLQNHPWAAVRHGDDHIHIAASRVNHEGQVWHGRNDFRQAQTAATELEAAHGLDRAPRQKTGERTPKSVINARHRSDAQRLGGKMPNEQGNSAQNLVDKVKETVTSSKGKAQEGSAQTYGGQMRAAAGQTAEKEAEKGHPKKAEKLVDDNSYAAQMKGSASKDQQNQQGHER